MVNAVHGMFIEVVLETSLYSTQFIAFLLYHDSSPMAAGKCIEWRSLMEAISTFPFYSILCIKLQEGAMG